MTARVLVTGSRDWPDPGAVRRGLDTAAARFGSAGLVIVHGACPTGADAHADAWARERAAAGVRVERHPARWDVHDDGCPPWHEGEARCRRAGPRRNAEMVAAGADLCLAFILGGSRGASGTVRLAEEAGILTMRMEWSVVVGGSQPTLPPA